MLVTGRDENYESDKESILGTCLLTYDQLQAFKLHNHVSISDVRGAVSIGLYSHSTCFALYVSTF